MYHGILVIDESKRCGVMQKLRLVNHSECFVQPLKANSAILLTFARQLSHYQTRATEILAIEINNVYLKFSLI